MRAPEENIQLLAALFDRTVLERRKGVTLPPSPWLLQLLEDLTVAGITTGLREDPGQFQGGW